MDPILDVIDAALKEKRLSDAAASKLAVGHPSLIKNLRMPRDGEKRYNLPALMKLAEVLDLEWYFGPPRETGPIQQVLLKGDSYAHIPLHDVLLAAGSGHANEHEEVIDHLAFRKDWLKKIGVPASTARLSRVSGDSMQPTLWAGDMIMIDTRIAALSPKSTSTKDQKRPPIYAIVDGGEARVKRLQRPADDMLMLLSDNLDYAPEYRHGKDIDTIQIIGKVVWWGHTERI